MLSHSQPGKPCVSLLGCTFAWKISEQCHDLVFHYCQVPIWQHELDEARTVSLGAGSSLTVDTAPKCANI